MLAHACRLIAILAAVVLIAPNVSAQEKVDFDKIPPKVTDALKAKFPNAKIHKCTKEKEGTDVVYDIEFKEGERKCEADIKEDGTYVNFEREIAEKDLPKAVTDAVYKKYPGAKFKEVMEITEVKGKDDKLEGYEIVMDSADKKEVEVTVTPDGKFLEDSSDEKKK